MNRGLCIVCLLVSTIARGQSFLSASAAESVAAIPNQAHAIVKAATVRPFGGASVKLAPVRNSQVNALSVYSDGRVVCAHCTLHFLATLAFDLPDWQVTGGSEWIGDAPFDLEVTAPEQPQLHTRTPLTEKQREVLRGVLKDRFGLQGHRETRTDTVYILERNGQQLKLAAGSHPESHSAEPGDDSGMGDAGIENISMHEFAIRISSRLKRSVLDRTGLTGTFHLPCGQSAAGGGEFAEVVSDSIRGAGLKLTPALGTIETFVIDHAEPPGDN